MDLTSFFVPIVVGYNVFVLFYFLLINCMYLVLMMLSAGQLRQYNKRRYVDAIHSGPCVMYPPISVLVPAYNERLSIVRSIQSLLNLNYSQLEIVVINDGSSDNTLETINDEFGLKKAHREIDVKLHSERVRGFYVSTKDRRLMVIDKDNGGKADALNAGINYSRGRLICSIDADSTIDRDALIKLVGRYMDRKDKVIALGGSVRIANGCTIVGGEVLDVRAPRSILASFQIIEYIRAFLFGRAGWNRLNALLIISGAFGLFDRKTVINAGGYKKDTVGEDMELVIRLHKHMRSQNRAYSAVFVPDPICWTEAPEELRILRNQRKRWQRGLVESLWTHRGMALRPRYGAVGMVGIPCFVVFEMLGPIIEMTGYFAIIFSLWFSLIDARFFLLFLLLAVLFGTILSVSALTLEEFTLKKYKHPRDVLKLLSLSILENVGYRQMISFWRLQAFWQVLRKRKDWGEMKRKEMSGDSSQL